MPDNDNDCILFHPRVQKLQLFMQTVCSAMNSTETYKQILPEMHKLANSLLFDHACNNVNVKPERAFSALKRLLTTYEQRRPRSTLIIACTLLHAQHQEITDDLNLVQVARNFVDANNERKKIFQSSRLQFCQY